MNLLSSTELSLYQLTQALSPPLHSFAVSSTTFRAILLAMVDFLIERKITATLWVKLPQSERWLTDIDRYCQHGQTDRIYWCNLPKETTATPPPSNSRIVPIVLETSSQLKREFFFIVLSPQFCGLILAQRQVASVAEEGALSQSRLKLVYSFEPSAIATILGSIKSAIAITDTTPEVLLTDELVPDNLPTSVDSSLLIALLLKQIQHDDALGTAKSEAMTRTQTEALNFNKELLSNLTQELGQIQTKTKTALCLLDSTQNKKEQRQRYLQLLEQQCDRQSSLLAGLLDIDRINYTSDESESSLKLEEMIPGIVSIYQSLAQEKGIILGYTVPAGLPAVSCPRNSIGQVIRNLLSNSLKFTPSKGRVHVKANLNNDVVEITVSDTGIGIDENDLTKIFNSFYRGRNAIASEIEGAGLGLTIVQQLLNRCDGSISVTSKLGKGSTFKVMLPVATA
ncbi:MAG: histidine kinase [Hydrococcus sp. RU_2_2]|jgi:two-component system, OmpR family, phosphate regulon sensor histidine kinase PhoR|nr:histidine kinase [Hydrococcus sp. RU_2_2]NJP21347.1 histidine kinase [Hydrococcus sp. CRU_1_1]